MKRRNMMLGAGIIAIPLALFGLMQLAPVGISYTNAPVVSEPKWDSPQTRALAKRACFDCHSNETAWPWYTHIAPISWLIQHDVNEGRQKLNFTEADTAQGRGDKAAEQIAKGSMPQWYYVLLHSSAGLSQSEKQQLMDGLKASLSRK